MRKYSSIGLSILVLAGTIIVSALWIRVFYTSIQNYRSPLGEIELSSQSPNSALTTKVVMVLVSGLGYDASEALDMPVLEQLQRAGATVAVESPAPTYAQTAWATLITGAPPETNDAPPIDVPLENLQPLAVDTIFARAQAVNLSTALLGKADWGRLIARHQLDYTFFVEEGGPESDRAILEAALPLIDSNNAGLILIHFTQIDLAAQFQGGVGDEAYRRAALNVDNYLDQIRMTLDLSHSVLVVMADYGHISAGGHGGDEIDVIWQPLVMIGENIIPGTYSDVYQTDIAPTISAILGLSPPAAAQGRILFETLQMTEDNQATSQLSLAQQRLALAEAYTTQIQGSQAASLDQLSTDLAQAHNALTANNVSGAFELALLAQEQADTHMIAVRNSRLRPEQLFRLLIAFIVVLVWFFIMWRRRGFYAGAVIIAALLSMVLYHAFYQLQGLTYSFSSLHNLADLPFDIARATTFSLLIGGGLVLIFLLLTDEGDWLASLGTGYGFGVWVTFLFTLPLFWAFWQNGIVASWRLPAVGPAFWQITGLFQVMSSAILGLLLPWPIMALALFVHLVRRRLSRSHTQPGPDALPGLHL